MQVREAPPTPKIRQYSISSIRLIASHTRSFAPPPDEVAVVAAAEVCDLVGSLKGIREHMSVNR